MREWVINLEERIVLNTPPKGYYSEPCDSVFVVEKSAYDALAAQLATCQKQLSIAVKTLTDGCYCEELGYHGSRGPCGNCKALADMRKVEGK